MIVDHMGSDQSVVDGARVSLARDGCDRPDEVNRKTLEYMLKEKHTGPFEHTRVTFKVEGTSRDDVITHKVLAGPHSEVTYDSVEKAILVTTDVHNYQKHLLSVCMPSRKVRELFPASMGERGYSRHKVRDLGRVELYDGQGSVELVNTLGEHMPYDSHTAMTFRFEVPLMVVRQHMRHRTWSYNEVSRRYTSEDLHMWTPGVVRKQAKRNMQCSDGELPAWKQAVARAGFKAWGKLGTAMYHGAIRFGVTREQARIILPQAMMVRYYATCSMASFKAWLRLRLDGHAQPEIQEPAKAALFLAMKRFPVQLAEFE